MTGSAVNGNTLDVTFHPITAGGTTRYKTDGYIEIQCKTANFEEDIIVNTLGTTTLSLMLNTGGSSKIINYKIDGGEEQSVKSGSKDVYFDFEFVGSGEHILKFYSAAKPGSNMKIFGIKATYTYEIAEEGETVVKFYDGESVIDTKAFGEGTAISYLPEERDHFTFDGWYLDAEFTNKLADDYVVDGTVTTLYGKWVEDAKYTVNYHLNAETTESEVLYAGSTLDYVPVSDTLGFNGWYFDEELTEAVPGDYTVYEDVDLYASWSELTYSIDPSNLTEETETGALTEKIIHFQNTIFTLTPGIKIDSTDVVLPDGTMVTHRLNMGGTSNWSEGNAKQRTIEFTAPSDGTLTVAFGSGTEGRKLQVRENYSQIFEQELIKAINKEYEVDGVTINNKTAEVAKLEVTKGNFYQVGAYDNIYLYQVTFTPKGAEVAPTAAINYQYDNDETPTAVRFIGTVANVDLTTVDSITLHFVKDGVAANKDVQIYTLYTSVAGQAEFAEAANTYYVVYVLNGVQSVLNQSLEVTMTVTFNNGAEALVATRTFTLGA